MKYSYRNLKDTYAIKDYTQYTEEEIIEMVDSALEAGISDHEYDCLIDALYFVQQGGQKGRKHSKNLCEYSYYTAANLNKKEKKNCSMEALKDKYYVQF